jgi:probable F420-dependent oxidoreductase
MEAFGDHVTILCRLWAGERFDYDGPAGRFEQLRLADRYEGPRPRIWYGGFGLPKAAKVIAGTPGIDGLLLPAMVTPLGVSRAVAEVRGACERVGRDPDSVRICASVVTAPDLSDQETRALAHARAVTYLQPPSWGHSYEVLNSWDHGVLARLRAHPQFSKSTRGIADLDFHRTELDDPASIIPDSWMRESCAIGSVDECVRTLQAFRDAGADEVTTYGSTPSQNAGLIDAWRRHTRSRAAARC